MVPIQTKEHLLYFMQSGLLTLSHYDLKFLQNLQTIVLSQKKITKNQVDLFEKIVKKYHRQLNKYNLIEKITINLKWTTEIIPSDPKFTNAHIFIENNIIFFRSPFNKKFLEYFRKVKNNSFVWSKDKKMYESPFNTFALKLIVDASHLHYSNVVYCEITKTLLNDLIDKFSNVKYWNPTLVKKQNNYYITASNQSLDLAIKHITFSDDPKVLAELSSYGITIDEEIINNKPINKLAAEYSVDFDTENVLHLARYLKQIECDLVVFYGKINNPHSYFLKNNLTDENIPFTEKFPTSIDDYKKPILISVLPHVVNRISVSKFFKIIKIKNSTPISIYEKM